MNTIPAIGILCIDISSHLKKAYNLEDGSCTYIPASYVKFLESAGAKVIPIWIGRDELFYRNILQKVNGVLLPGGALYLNEPGGYAEAGTHIYNIACKMNQSGDYMPILGICLGYELMMYVAANVNNSNGKFKDPRQDCDGNNHCLPLFLKPNLGKGQRMFGDVSCDILDIFTNEAVTYNYHRYCITEKDLDNYNLSNDWRVISTNKDRKGLEYISSVEHKRFPFYGLQFHPEKNAYEQMTDHKSCCTQNAIKASQYLANFFVNETRKNQHKFNSLEDKHHHLIYNYPVTFTALKKSKFLQCYIFDSNVNYGNC